MYQQPVHSLNAHNKQAYTGAKPKSYDCNIELPCRWQEVNLLSHYHCLPMSALAGNQSQEVELLRNQTQIPEYGTKLLLTSR